MHGRREDNRAARREQRIGQQVIGHAVSSLCQKVRCRWRYYEQVGGLPDPNVGHLVDVVPDVCGYGLSGQGSPGCSPDETQCGPRRHNPDGVIALNEEPQKVTDLVGGDAAAYT
jgi:hypothetical protein